MAFLGHFPVHLCKQSFKLNLNWKRLDSVHRGLKTTSTVHPNPQFKDDEQLLEKIIEGRKQNKDMPVSLANNPYQKPKKKCILCEHKIMPDYKNVKLLYQFVSPHTGMVYGRHITGLCSKMQEKVETQIQIAVYNGFMSNYLKEVEFIKDPKICDPEKLKRPHKY